MYTHLDKLNWVIALPLICPFNHINVNCNLFYRKYIKCSKLSFTFVGTYGCTDSYELYFVVCDKIKYFRQRIFDLEYFYHLHLILSNSKLENSIHLSHKNKMLISIANDCELTTHAIRTIEVICTVLL